MRFLRRSFLTGLALSAPDRPARGAPSRPLRQRLAAAFEKIALFDSHEHLWDEQQRISEPIDFFALTGDYVVSDLVSAGMPAEAVKIIRDIGRCLPHDNAARFFRRAGEAR